MLDNYLLLWMSKSKKKNYFKTKRLNYLNIYYFCNWYHIQSNLIYNKKLTIIVYQCPTITPTIKIFMALLIVHPKQKEIDFQIEQLTKFHLKCKDLRQREIIFMTLLLNTTFNFIKEKLTDFNPIWQHYKTN